MMMKPQKQDQRLTTQTAKRRIAQVYRCIVQNKSYIKQYQFGHILMQLQDRNVTTKDGHWMYWGFPCLFRADIHDTDAVNDSTKDYALRGEAEFIALWNLSGDNGCMSFRDYYPAALFAINSRFLGDSNCGHRLWVFFGNADYRKLYFHAKDFLEMFDKIPLDRLKLDANVVTYLCKILRKIIECMVHQQVVPSRQPKFNEQKKGRKYRLLRDPVVNKETQWDHISLLPQTSKQKAPIDEGVQQQKKSTTNIYRGSQRLEQPRQRREGQKQSTQQKGQKQFIQRKGQQREQKQQLVDHKELLNRLEQAYKEYCNDKPVVPQLDIWDLHHLRKQYKRLCLESENETTT